MAHRYVDICIQPVPKSKLAMYKKNTRMVGKILLKHGALASRDYTADDKNATKDSFPKKIKIKNGEVLVYAIAEFKSRTHREQVFKKMMKDPAMIKLMSQTPFVDPKRMVVGGFKLLVSVE